MRIRMMFAIVLVLLSAIPAAGQKKLNVVTTLNYLAHIAARIGGERVNAVALANPRQDPHYVTPTPAMNQTAYGADLFVEIGLNLDLWAKNVIDASGNPRIQRGSPGHLVATLNVSIKELPTEVSRAWGDIHPQGNPHVWLDPLNAQIIAENIAARLEELDPAGAPLYRSNRETFVHHIDEMMYGDKVLEAIGKGAGDILSRKARNGQLFDWLRRKRLLPALSGWMREAMEITEHKIVSYHKTYVYFADRFGLDIAGELEDKPGIPPPPQRRDQVVNLVRREGIKVILNDNFYARDAADYVASKTGAHVLITYIDVGAAEQVDTYEKLISYLLESIAVTSR